MKQSYSHYIEKLPERFSVRHKTIEYDKGKKTFHLHNELEMVFALSDNIICRWENGSIKVPRNSLLLLNPSDLHYLYTEEGSTLCERYVLYFSTNYISDFSSEVNLLECFMLRKDKRPIVLSVPDHMQYPFLKLMEKMAYYHKSAKGELPAAYGAALHLRLLLGELLLITNELFLEQFQLTAAPMSLRHTQLVYDIQEYIRHHYHEPLTSESIAEAFLISKTQLYNIFKEVGNLTVSDYITDYRIAQAKNLLLNSDHSIETISQSVGYYNLSSFSRAFKASVKVSPLQYRKKMSSKF